MYKYVYKYLATKRAESERIEEATVTDLTGIGDTLTRPRLWSLIQEYNSCTVYNVRLDPTYVHIFLNLRYPYHIMVR